MEKMNVLEALRARIDATKLSIIEVKLEKLPGSNRSEITIVTADSRLLSAVLRDLRELIRIGVRPAVVDAQDAAFDAKDLKAHIHATNLLDELGKVEETIVAAVATLGDAPIKKPQGIFEWLWAWIEYGTQYLVSQFQKPAAEETKPKRKPKSKEAEYWSQVEQHRRPSDGFESIDVIPPAPREEPALNPDEDKELEIPDWMRHLQTK